MCILLLNITERFPLAKFSKPKLDAVETVIKDLSANE